MDPAEKIKELNRIYAASWGSREGMPEEAPHVCSCLRHNYALSACGSEKDAAFLRACLYDEDYLVRSRAFALAQREPALAMGKALLSVIFGNEEREWQLRALAALSKVGTKAEVFALRPLVFQEEAPLLLRGALWVFVSNSAYVGEETLTLLAAFLHSPYCAYLKTGFVADVIAFALERTDGGEALWRALCQQDSVLERRAAFYAGYAAKNPLLQVYPYPDYLTKAAAKREISAKALKQALYFKELSVAQSKKKRESGGGASTDSAGF